MPDRLQDADRPAPEEAGYRAAILEGRVDPIGPPRLTNQFQSWFRTSPFADFIPVDPVARAGDELEGVLDAGAVRDG
ncbi:MAG TPA: hypothetical protein VI094_04690 [Propionibacteriaceae bacterium]